MYNVYDLCTVILTIHLGYPGNPEFVYHEEIPDEHDRINTEQIPLNEWNHYEDHPQNQMIMYANADTMTQCQSM